MSKGGSQGEPRGAQRCDLRGEPRGATHHVEEGTYMHSRSFCADKDEDVEERETMLVLEGNQCYKIWRSLLIWIILESMILE